MKKTKSERRSFVLNIGSEKKIFKYSYPAVRADGRLYVYINSGRFKPNGRIKYDSVYARNEFDLMKNIEAYYRRRLDVGLTSNQTIAVAMTNWMKTHKKNILKPRSYDTMEDSLRLYVFPYIGDIKVSDVNCTHCQDIINKLTDKGYSLSVISKVFVHLKDFFNFMVNSKSLTYNPMCTVSKPNESVVAEKRKKLKKVDKTIKYFTREQVESIKKVIYDGYTTTGVSRSNNPYHQKDNVMIYQAPIFDFLLQTGLRASEMCALKYSNWDAENKTITISSTRTQSKKRDEETYDAINTKKEVLETTPKTKSSYATIHLSDYANDILVALHNQEKPDYNSYILHTVDGKPMTKDNGLRGRWHRLLAAANIEKKEQVTKIVEDKNGNKIEKKQTVIHEEYGLHTLRHTYASFLYEETKDILFVSKKLRHSDPAFTARIYVSIMAETEKRIDKDFKI